MKNKIAVLYFGGMLGNKHSSTLKKLKEHCMQADFIYMDYERTDPIAAKKQLDITINKTVQTYQQVILCGNSLGGYWANYYCEQTELPCVLINPSFFPRTNLIKYKIDNKILNKFIDSTFLINKKHALLGRQDNIVDNIENEKLLQNIQSITWVDQGHRLSNYDTLIKILNTLINEHI